MKKRKSNLFFFSFFKLTTRKISRRTGYNFKHTILFAISLILLVTGLWLKIAATSPLAFTGTIDIPVKTADASQMPANINIPSISTLLPIEQKIIKNGEWGVSENGVSHLITSGTPGYSGNIILYGHNTSSALKDLQKVKIGETITIMDKNGKSYTYKIYSIKTVYPDDIGFLTSFENQTLTIYTCIGFADLKRLVVKAERINYISASPSL